MITAVVTITSLMIRANRGFGVRSDGRISLISIVLDVMAPLWLWEGVLCVCVWRCVFVYVARILGRPKLKKCRASSVRFLYE